MYLVHVANSLSILCPRKTMSSSNSSKSPEINKIIEIDIGSDNSDIIILDCTSLSSSSSSTKEVKSVTKPLKSKLMISIDIGQVNCSIAVGYHDDLLGKPHVVIWELFQLLRNEEKVTPKNVGFAVNAKVNQLMSDLTNLTCPQNMVAVIENQISIQAPNSNASTCYRNGLVAAAFYSSLLGRGIECIGGSPQHVNRVFSIKPGGGRKRKVVEKCRTPFA